MDHIFGLCAPICYMPHEALLWRACIPVYEPTNHPETYLKWSLVFRTFVLTFDAGHTWLRSSPPAVPFL
jgi:hypothetical protein